MPSLPKQLCSLNLQRCFDLANHPLKFRPPSPKRSQALWGRETTPQYVSHQLMACRCRDTSNPKPDLTNMNPEICNFQPPMHSKSGNLSDASHLCPQTWDLWSLETCAPSNPSLQDFKRQMDPKTRLFVTLSGTGDSQRDSRESIRANDSQLTPYFYSASDRFARITRISDSRESIRANHATKYLWDSNKTHAHMHSKPKIMGPQESRHTVPSTSWSTQERPTPELCSLEK